MAYPVVRYAASGGSDTAASGAGPTTAVTGSSAAHTGGVSSTTITLTNTPDLSGVASDGSAALWLNTSSGSRHLSKITAVDDGADTVTVEDSFNIAAGSAVDYAIGGSRQTLENDSSNRDVQDYKNGWRAEFDAGTYNMTAMWSLPGAGTAQGIPWCGFVAKSGAASRPIINMNANTWCFVGGGNGFRLYCEGLKFTDGGSASTNAAVLVASRTNAAIRFVDCVFNMTAAYYQIQLNNPSSYVFEDCYFVDGPARSHISCAGGGLVMQNCWIEGKSSASYDSMFVAGSCNIRNCVFEGNAGVGPLLGMRWGSGQASIVENCVFHDGGGDGIEVDFNTYVQSDHIFRNNIFTENAGYGINIDAAGVDAEGVPGMFDYNAFRNNTSGNYNNATGGANDVTLTADPYTNASSGDFSLNDTAGGGAACRGAGFPGAMPDGT